MLYNLQQRIFFVKTYYDSKGIIAVQRAFVNKHNVKSALSRKSILAAVKIFKKNGNVTCVYERKGQKMQSVFMQKESLFEFEWLKKTKRDQNDRIDEFNTEARKV